MLQVRALANGKGYNLGADEEQSEAELLRQACHDALCRSKERSRKYPDARKQVIYGYGDMKSYCKNLARPTFWGGEVEMMIITKMLSVPIFVYQSVAELGGECALFPRWSGRHVVDAKYAASSIKPCASHFAAATVHSRVMCAGFSLSCHTVTASDECATAGWSWQSLRRP